MLWHTTVRVTLGENTVDNNGVAMFSYTHYRLRSMIVVTHIPHHDCHRDMVIVTVHWQRVCVNLKANDGLGRIVTKG